MAINEDEGIRTPDLGVTPLNTIREEDRSAAHYPGCATSPKLSVIEATA